MEELKVLLVEDSEQDAELIIRTLRVGGYSPEFMRVETLEEMKDALSQKNWHLVLCDHDLPGFNSEHALGLAREYNADLPFIVVSGVIGEERAVELMRIGANDFVMKGNLKRLVPAVQREIHEAEGRRRRKIAEEELRKKQDELSKKEEELRVAKQIDALKDEFIGMVSHELKTPLTVIIGALNVAETEGFSPDQTKELIQEASRSAEGLSAMIDNLLELSRQQSNRLSIKAKPTEIGPLMETVVKKFQGIADSHHVRQELPSSLPRVLIDPIRIERVLNNLIENAVKYSPKGGEIKVAVQTEKTQMIVSVSDEGIGISPKDCERLFRPFERLGVQDKFNIGGVGLGLRVCQILVEAHQGKIWVESTQGMGSTFFFSLPLALPELLS